MVRTSSICMIVVVCIVCSMNCTKSVNPGFVVPTADDLIGRWNYLKADAKSTIRMVLAGVIDSTIHVDSTIAFTGNDDFYIFRNATRYYSEENEASGRVTDFFRSRPLLPKMVKDSGTWTLNGENLNMLSDIDSNNVSFAVRLSRSTLTFTMTFDTTFLVNPFTVTVNTTAVLYTTKSD